MDRRSARIHKLIQMLNAPGKNRTWRARGALIAIGTDAVQPLIDAAASVQTMEAKLWIPWILGCIGDPRGFDTILAFTRDEDLFVRHEAIWALGKLRDARAVDFLIDSVLSDRSPGSEHNALAAMREVAVPRLLEIARTGSVEARRHAVFALGGSTNEEAVDLLSTALGDPDEQIRLSAVSALAQTGEDHAGKMGQRCLELISTRPNDQAESVRDSAEFNVIDLRKTLERLRYAHPKPRSHRLRLIISENSDYRIELGYKIRRRLRHQLNARAKRLAREIGC